MSIKGAAEAVLPPPAQGWLKQAIYHRNCHLSPPQYRAALKHWYWLFKGRPCHLEAPRTMTEKIHWLKLYDSTPLKGRLADKFLVREWVADTVGEEYLVPLLGVWDSPDEIDFASLPLDKAIKEVRGNGKLKVAVFSDPDCPYCKRLEHEFEKMTDITIYNFMMPIPSLHPDAARKAEILWCQPNPTQAWTDWMRKGQFPSGKANCENPVAETTSLGEQFGFNGTPTLVFPNGRSQSGYSPMPHLKKIIEDNQK